VLWEGSVSDPVRGVLYASRIRSPSLASQASPPVDRGQRATTRRRPRNTHIPVRCSASNLLQLRVHLRAGPVGSSKDRFRRTGDRGDEPLADQRRPASPLTKPAGFGLPTVQRDYRGDRYPAQVVKRARRRAARIRLLAYPRPCTGTRPGRQKALGPACDGGADPSPPRSGALGRAGRSATTAAVPFRPLPRAART
jgi:hypothetical protein